MKPSRTTTTMGNRMPQNGVADHEARRQVAVVREAVDSIRADVHELRAGIFARLDAMDQRQRPNLGVLATAGGVLLAFVAAIGGMALAPLHYRTSTNAAAITEGERTLRAHLENGHAGTRADLANLKTMLNVTEVSLRREMLIRLACGDRCSGVAEDMSITVPRQVPIPAP